MSKMIRTMPGKIIVLAVTGLLALYTFAGCDTSSSPGENSRDDTSADIVLPAPVETVLPPTVVPQTPPPLDTPVPLPPPPSPESFPYDNTAPSPNMAWGVETSRTLTIWVGIYSDVPEPSISQARPLVRWNVWRNARLRLLDMSVSPDHRSLAVLSITEGSSEMEGDLPTWLSVINLGNNTVQSVPDYSRSDVYMSFLQKPPARILGWLDNDRLALLEISTPIRAVIATKDGASYAEVPFPPQYSTAPKTALSPDRTRLFSYGSGGFWLYNIDGSNPRNIIADTHGPTSPDNPTWSPSGKHISFESPLIQVKEGKEYVDYDHRGVWILDLNTLAQKLVSAENSWSVAPTWSLDGSELAFLSADDSTKGRDNKLEKINSNIFVADVITLNPSKLTKFVGKKNSGLQWTPSGNLILSSTAESQDGTLDLVAVQKKDGKVQKLRKKAPDSPEENIVRPLVFK